MHDISKLIRENRKEAYDIIKAHGGKIEFVKDIIHNNPDNDEEDDWIGSIGEENVPWVILGFDEIVDTAVLAVKCGKNEPNIEFLAFDNDSYECIGWCDDASCCSNTENAIYEVIGNLK